MIKQALFLTGVAVAIVACGGSGVGGGDSTVGTESNNGAANKSDMKNPGGPGSVGAETNNAAPNGAGGGSSSGQGGGGGDGGGGGGDCTSVCAACQPSQASECGALCAQLSPDQQACVAAAGSDCNAAAACITSGSGGGGGAPPAGGGGSSGVGGGTGSCSYPNCGGCTTSCDACLCAFQGDSTQCTAYCG